MPAPWSHRNRPLFSFSPNIEFSLTRDLKGVTVLSGRHSLRSLGLLSGYFVLIPLTNFVSRRLSSVCSSVWLGLKLFQVFFRLCAPVCMLKLLLSALRWRKPNSSSIYFFLCFACSAHLSLLYAIRGGSVLRPRFVSLYAWCF